MYQRDDLAPVVAPSDPILADTKLPSLPRTVNITEEDLRRVIVKRIVASGVQEHQPRPELVDGNAQCTHRAMPGVERCGAPLFRPARFWHLPNNYGDNISQQPSMPIPQKTVIVQHVKPWLQSLLEQPGVLARLRQPPAVYGETLEDMWDSPEFASLIPDGDCVRLVFALFIDWFDPKGGKLGGSQHSDGSTYLTLLNLPKEERYHHDKILQFTNIPGPQMPNKDQISHVLRPLVEEFIEFDQKPLVLGNGLEFLGLLIPAIFDTQAHRKCTGRTSHSHGTFPCWCFATSRTFHTLRTEDLQPRFSLEEHRTIARIWRSATRTEDREWIASNYGVRWTELLRLPHWDVNRYAGPEILHLFLAGNVHDHLRFKIRYATTAAAAVITPSPPDAAQVNKATNILSLRQLPTNVEGQFLPMALGSLQHVYQICHPDKPYPKTKKDLIIDIVSWVRVICSSLVFFRLQHSNSTNQLLTVIDLHNLSLLKHHWTWQRCALPFERMQTWNPFPTPAFNTFLTYRIHLRFTCGSIKRGDGIGYLYLQPCATCDSQILFKPIVQGPKMSSLQRICLSICPSH